MCTTIDIVLALVLVLGLLLLVVVLVLVILLVLQALVAMSWFWKMRAGLSKSSSHCFPACLSTFIELCYTLMILLTILHVRAGSGKTYGILQF